VKGRKIYSSSPRGEIVLLDQVLNSFHNLRSDGYGRFDGIGIIGGLVADRPQVEEG
jgi:hypothetical protein